MPQDIAICFTIYESAKAYHQEFFNALLQLNTGDRQVTLLILEDGYSLPTEAYEKLSHKFLIKAISPQPNLNVTETRIFLLKEAIKMTASFLIFTDSDDFLHKEALNLHLDALESADFSFGDQMLVDSESLSLGHNLFDDSSVPEELKSFDQILHQNYCGLSALAFKRESLAKLSVSTISPLVTALDWNLVSNALLLGLTGRKTKSSVVYYRQHENNIFQSSEDLREYFLRRAKDASSHYSSIDHPHAKDALKTIQYCENLLQSDSEELKSLLKHHKTYTFPWFQDISKLAQACKNLYNLSDF